MSDRFSPFPPVPAISVILPAVQTFLEGLVEAVGRLGPSMRVADAWVFGGTPRSDDLAKLGIIAPQSRRTKRIALVSADTLD